MIAWAKQHIEENAKEGSQEFPDGVLMILPESNGQAAKTVGPYQYLEGELCSYLRGSRKDFTARRAATHCAPEVLWLVKAKSLSQGIQKKAFDQEPSLVLDLAHRLFMSQQSLIQTLMPRYLMESAEFDRSSLTSDEHGIVCAS